jgi:hypothetical protein
MLAVPGWGWQGGAVSPCRAQGCHCCAAVLNLLQHILLTTSQANMCWACCRLSWYSEHLSGQSVCFEARLNHPITAGSCDGSLTRLLHACCVQVVLGSLVWVDAQHSQPRVDGRLHPLQRAAYQYSPDPQQRQAWGEARAPAAEQGEQAVPPSGLQQQKQATG